MQQVFDAAWKEFVENDNPPAVEYLEYDQRYFCRYCTAEGRKCAIGLCLPLAHRAVDIRNSVDNLISSFPELFEENPSIPRWVNLQKMLHDQMINHSTGRWLDELSTCEQRREHYRKIAERFDLKVPV
jgi:hypothetical protein